MSTHPGLRDQPPATAGADAPTARSVASVAPAPQRLLVHLVLGMLFGIVLIKSEAVSWFRIQEMFRFQSFHMYGILGSGVLVAGTVLAVIRRMGVRGLGGRPIVPESKEWVRGYGQLLGGTVFGFGWALLGACPGPIYALIGHGITVMVIALVSAVAGAWTYGHLRPWLPH